MIKTYDVATIRKDFPIFDTGIAYLDSANTSQRPRQVTGLPAVIPAKTYPVSVEGDEVYIEVPD